MYQPALFREDRLDVMQGLMRAHPFALLVSTQTGALAADHLPLALHEELSEKGTLHGHIAKGNPLWLKRDWEVAEVLCVFQGPQAYITPSWYPSKQQHGNVVPTWNYAVVHAQGTLHFREDPNWLLAHLNELTARQEGHLPDAWQVSDAPEDYIARQLKGIVGIEVEVTSLDGKWKMSQNKEEMDRMGVAQGLSQAPGQDAAAVSQLVKRAGN